MNAVLHLICQGETLASRNSRFPANDELSERASSALSLIEGNIRPGSKIWLAPELAAQQTATAMRLKGKVVPQLAEPSYGHWAGLPVKQVMKNNGETFHHWLSGDAPPGGESITALISRTGEWLSQKVGEGEHHCAIVSAPVIRAMIIGLLNVPVSAQRRLDIASLSRTILTSSGTRWNVCTLGEKL